MRASDSLAHHAAFVSDLHVLSRYGLVPPSWRHARDPLLPVQKYLWRCWQDFVRRCPPLDVLVIVGDLIEGTVQVRAEPRGVVSDDAADQVEACQETLGQLSSKARKTYIVAGSAFHDSAGDRLEAVGYRLRSVRWAPGRRHAGQVLNLVWRGLHVNASHHQTRGWMWLGGAASRLAVLSAATEAARKLPRADVIVRGDLHTSVKLETLGKWVCFLPGWTMPNPHAIRRMEATRAYLATDIGGAVIALGANRQIGWLPGLTYQLCTPDVHRVR